MQQRRFAKRSSWNQHIDISIHASLFLYFACLLLFLPIPWVFGALLSAGIHELSHYLVIRLMGIPVFRLSISPLGMKMNTGPMGELQEIIASAAGPVAGFCLVPLFPMIPETAVCAFVHSVFNLLPIYPFDGGRIVNALLMLVFEEPYCRIVGRGIGLLTYLLLSVCAVWLLRYSVFLSILLLVTVIRCISDRHGFGRVDT